MESEYTDGQFERTRQAAVDFRVANPAYVANERNGTLVDTALQYKYGGNINSFEEIESVYEELKERGLLELNEEVLAQQEREASQARINRARAFRSGRHAEAAEASIEDNAWAMDLETLRQVADQEAREQHIRENQAMAAGFDYTPSRPRVPGRRIKSGI